MIVNSSNKKILASKVELADSFWHQARGLMFRKSLPPGCGLLMDFGKDGRPGIWMFGMRFPINIVYIDSCGTVVDIKNARPLTLNPKTWRVYYPKRPARYVLELPAGTAKETGTKTGDRVVQNNLFKG